MSGALPDALVAMQNSTHNTPHVYGTDPLGTHQALIDNIDTALGASRPRLLHMARAYGVPPDAADDIVQETLLEAWLHLDHLRSPERFEAWLTGICRNVCLRWSRAQGVATTKQVPFSHLHGLQDAGEEEGLEAIPDPAIFDPAEELSRQDMHIMLDRALGYLPRGTREAVELYYLAELPQREAALRLGMTIHALEERLYRARRQLRRLLNNELRHEAESFGLLVDQESSAGWRETREWCITCGRRYEIGLLESRDGKGRLITRCPSCYPLYGDNNRSCWLPQLSGLRSFRPAIKRLTSVMRPHMSEGVANGEGPCMKCGKPAKFHLAGPDEPHGNLQRHFPDHALVLECAACGSSSTMWACGATAWSSPALNNFMGRHPQATIGPEAVIEYENQPALRFCLIDVTSSAKIIIIAHYQTLQVMATFEE